LERGWFVIKGREIMKQVNFDTYFEDKKDFIVFEEKKHGRILTFHHNREKKCIFRTFFDLETKEGISQEWTIIPDARINTLSVYHYIRAYGNSLTEKKKIELRSWLEGLWERYEKENFYPLR
jgi:hypothetical protein